MGVSLLLITHGGLGQELLDTAAGILGHVPLPAAAIAVSGDCDPDRVAGEAARRCEDMDSGDGVLILTDLFGSTPSNIAARLLDDHHALILTGVNVPMLVRIFNYPSLPLDELASRATSGARDGVILTSASRTS